MRRQVLTASLGEEPAGDRSCEAHIAWLEQELNDPPDPLLRIGRRRGPTAIARPCWRICRNWARWSRKQTCRPGGSGPLQPGQRHPADVANHRLEATQERAQGIWAVASRPPVRNTSAAGRKRWPWPTRSRRQPAHATRVSMAARVARQFARLDRRTGCRRRRGGDHVHPLPEWARRRAGAAHRPAGETHARFPPSLPATAITASSPTGRGRPWNWRPTIAAMPRSRTPSET